MTMDVSDNQGCVGQVASRGAVSPCAKNPASERNTVTEEITGSHLALNSPVESSLLLYKTGIFPPFNYKKKHTGIP